MRYLGNRGDSRGECAPLHSIGAVGMKLQPNLVGILSESVNFPVQ